MGTGLPLYSGSNLLALYTQQYLCGARLRRGLGAKTMRADRYQRRRGFVAQLHRQIT